MSLKCVCVCVSVLQVTLYHLLKLFQSDSSAMPKKTVVSEFYDEMVGFVQTHSPGGSMGFDGLLSMADYS